MHFLDFRHQLVIDGQTAGSIDNHHAVTLGTRLRKRSLCHRDRILLPFHGKYRHSDLLSEGLQLLNRSRTETVAGCKKNLHTLPVLQMQCQFAGEGCLTGTVETGYQHNSRLPLDVDCDILRTHEVREFIVDNLHHHLLRFHRCQHIGAQSLFLYPVAEFFRDLVADVRVEQRPANLLDGFGYVYFGDFPFTLEYLERPFKPF